MDLVLATYERYKPKAIFIVTFRIMGIIGEDVDSNVEILKEYKNGKVLFYNGRPYHF
ncbi:MAG: hypothetical protein ACYDG2_15565 [Ruminiclostridium sp.]